MAKHLSPKTKYLSQQNYEYFIRYMNKNSVEDLYNQIDKISFPFNKNKKIPAQSAPKEIYNLTPLSELTENEHPKIIALIPDLESELILYLKKHPEFLYEISPRKFEELVAEIFKNQGFNVELTPQTRDGGYDIIAVENNLLTGKNIYLIECKKYSMDNTVGIGVIQRMLGVVTQQKVNKGIIATTSLFTKDAIQGATHSAHLLELKNYQNLLEWIKNYQV